MPLGLLTGMDYEMEEIILEPGDSLLLYSDGLVEAHNPQRQMFGFPRLSEYVSHHEGGAALIESLLEDLQVFTGPDWEQEDDVTLVTVQRALDAPFAMGAAANPTHAGEANMMGNWQTLAEFSVPSEEGNERQVMQRVAEAVQALNMPAASVEKLKTAVAEATMNAIEHGNHNNPDLPVQVQVKASPQLVSVHITDEGGSTPIPESEAPDLDAKLAGIQSPRGWGLFLIKQFVDEMNVITDEKHHTVELILHLKGTNDGSHS
jgi:anti-sigma regulatory factor (Ser/Thr protein kinase)